MTNISPARRWRLKRSRYGNESVVIFTGHRRYGAVPDVVLGRQLAKIVDKHSRGNLRLDFRHVEFLTSADIGRLVRLWKKLKDDGRRLALHNVKPLVYQVFQVIRLNELMEIRDKRTDNGKGDFGIDKPKR